MKHEKNNKHVLIKFLFCLLLLPALTDAQQAPVDDLLLFKHAVSLTEKGRWSDAAILFKDIASRNPTWPEPKNDLAIALFKLGKIEQAQQALEDAVVSLPSFKVAQLNRKKLYDHAAAMAYYKAVGISEKPERPQLEMLTEVKKEPVATSPVNNNSQPVNQSTASIVSNIRKSLLNWSKAWSDVDIDRYLSAYSNDFIPSNPGTDYTQWRMLRRAKLKYASKLDIKLTNVQVYLNEDKNQALVEFIQDYKSARFQDRVQKQLQLVYENERWLILSERVLRQIH